MCLDAAEAILIIDEAAGWVAVFWLVLGEFELFKSVVVVEQSWAGPSQPVCALPSWMCLDV